MGVKELLLNALEHGMKGRTRGLITLTLSDLGDAVKLEVQDNGAGLPPDFEQKHSGSLGLQIIRTLVKDDLKGTLEYTSLQPEDATSVNEAEEERSGAKAIVVFPKRPLNAD